MHHESIPINYLEISREALAYNADAIRNYVQTPIIAVLKCDGYGVSLPEAARIWADHGAAMFAVSQPQEALALRQAGFQQDILLLSPVADAHTLMQMLELGIILTVTGPENARFYQSFGQPIRAHIAVDTGMGRFGLRWTDIDAICGIYAMEGFTFEGIFSHFSASFEKTYRKTKLQLDRFLELTDSLDVLGISVGMRHIANSCAALRFPHTRLDAVRIGSAFIGEVGADIPILLKRAGVLKAQVVDSKTLQAGDTTGYASICRVRRDTGAIVVALGHENGIGFLKTPDGFRPRDLAAYMVQLLRNRRNPPWVEYEGQRLPLVGRIGSQYSLFDAGGLTIVPGEYVTAQADMLFPCRERRLV